MKKFFLITMFIAAGFAVKAQLIFGAQGGADFASVRTEAENYSSTSDKRTGFTLGVVATLPAGNHAISFRPELNFIQKGGKTDQSTEEFGYGYTAKANFLFNYLQLSPNFIYNMPAGKGKVFLGLGPQLALGISGKQKYVVTITGPDGTETTSGSGDIKFDGDGDDPDPETADAHLKAFEFGANLLGGYQLSNGAFISVGYTGGFSNISPYDGSSVKNHGFAIKAGFMFGGGKAAKNKKIKF